LEKHLQFEDIFVEEECECQGSTIFTSAINCNTMNLNDASAEFTWDMVSLITFDAVQ